MRLNSIERDFLTRLSIEPWTSPPVFDHRLLDRLVHERYVTSQAAALDAVHYEITISGEPPSLRWAEDGGEMGQRHCCCPLHARHPDQRHANPLSRIGRPGQAALRIAG
jgi:hypothetical protein